MDRRPILRMCGCIFKLTKQITSFIITSCMDRVYKWVCAIVGLCVCGFCGATTARGVVVDIHPNANGTVGTHETAPYKNLENLEVILMPGTQCVGTGAFKGWDNLLSVTCEGSNGKDGVAIGAAAFKNCCNLRAVGFNRTGDIGMCAFEGCRSLVMLNVSHSENIFQSAFKNCTSLSELRVGKGVYWVNKDRALEGCPLVQVIEQ